MGEQPRAPVPGACDCHVHVIGPKSRFPLASPRSYTPVDAPFAALEAMMAHAGLERAVIVQPSIYGTDNACTLDALDRLGPRGRAVVVLDPATPGSELDALDGRGVRGIRINIVSRGSAPVEQIRDELNAAVALCARNGWHVQLFVSAAVLDKVAPLLAGLPVEVVLDHFAMIPPGDADGPAADLVCRLLGEGRVWVKLSASYRITADAFAPAVDRLARRFAAANPERLVWASDWPHTPAHSGQQTHGDEELPYRDFDDAALLDLLARWVGLEHSARILAANPARLYGFA